MSQFSIYFIRHGQTYFNLFNRMQGWSDSPLTDYGKQIATQVGEALRTVPFDAVYASDSKRAVDTARLIQQAAGQPNVPFNTLMNFREVFYGYFEGGDSSRTWSLVGRQYGVNSLHALLTKINIEETRDLMKTIDPWHEAEDNVAFWQRLDAGFDYLKTHHDHHEKVLVVSHGTTIRSIAAHFAPDLDISRGPKNGSLTRLDVDGDQIKLVTYAKELVPTVANAHS